MSSWKQDLEEYLKDPEFRREWEASEEKYQTERIRIIAGIVAERNTIRKEFETRLKNPEFRDWWEKTQQKYGKEFETISGFKENLIKNYMENYYESQQLLVDAVMLLRKGETRDELAQQCFDPDTVNLACYLEILLKPETDAETYENTETDGFLKRFRGHLEDPMFRRGWDQTEKELGIKVVSDAVFMADYVKGFEETMTQAIRSYMKNAGASFEEACSDLGVTRPKDMALYRGLLCY